jgi:iron complex outermembrane receptor protein
MGISIRREFGGRRMRRVLLASTACFALGMGAAFAQSASFSLPEQPLSQSLKDVARQTGENILFTPEAVAGLKGHAISGQMTAQQAVSALIAGTGLETVSDDNGGLIVRKPQPKNAQAASNAGAESPEEVVVTGTHIEGVAPVGSQVTVYTRLDLDQSGAATLDQFAREIPENVANLDGISNFASNSGLAARSPGDESPTGGAGFNLGGLGVASTLTLINGQRVGASGENGAFVDISMIPYSAIDHIEVLQDGASSIYGSDAIAGVVNIIMRQDFDGAETSLRYGGATDGGADEFTASQLIGKAWSSGSFLVNYEYDSQTGLDAAQRGGYIPPQGGPTSLLPESQRNSLFFYGHQDIDSATTISAQILYSHRNAYTDQSVANAFESVAISQPARSTQTDGTLTINRKLWGDWDASLTGNYSNVDQVFLETEVVDIPSYGINESVASGSKPNSKTYGLDALANGTVWTIAGGDIKTAIGASYRYEGFSTSVVENSAFVQTPFYNRHVESVFGEVYIPLIGEANALPYLRRLEISGAVRFDDYSDFGSTTNPKVGVVASPIDDLKIRGTWGTSFRAPLLTELHEPQVYEAEYYADPNVPAGKIDTLLEIGGNPNLNAETATVFTVGADWQPHWDPALSLSATYSNVNYKNLIGTPVITNQGTVFTDPTLTPFINLHPNPAVVAAAFLSPTFNVDYTHAGPAAVQAILDQQEANLAAETEATIEYRASYNWATDVGHFLFSGVAYDFVNDTLKSAPAAPAESLINLFGEPPRWKGRASASWSDNGFTAMLSLNYVNAYNDNLAGAGTPNTPIASWTTEDLYLSYNLGPSDGAGLLQNMRFALSMQNIMDTKPPFTLIPAGDLLPGQNPISFDPVNASPIGRLIAIQVTKDF